jgi:hypothetical protein
MKKYLIIVLLITGCSNQVDDFVVGRFLKDKNGCAFLVTRDDSASYIRLSYSKEESSETCNFKPEIK